MHFIQPDRKQELSDKELARRFRHSGDLEELGILYGRYMHLVYGVCLKYLKNQEESQDAVMQVFEKLVSELPRHEVENFKSWLYVLVKNHCLMHLRAQKSKLNQEGLMAKENQVFMESTLEVHPMDDAPLEKDLAALQHCIEQLKAQQKECIKLFYLEGKCYREIVELLGLDLKHVKSFIQNGRRNLKICLEQHHG